ncbi:hypothetical protein L1987_64862 [Smallanthus sonchifolius]|uniref:Uncharacterized protein n=1 Tax=Smallanthus sonchifolius TaxID=185202 RepID=A0ACB9BSQ5_9ASTR|nr:hypothetical protein L1987_64862 [Smallanthus sonchifolius]
MTTFVEIGAEILNTSFAIVGDDEMIPKNVFVEDGVDSTVAFGEPENIPTYWSLSTGFQNVADLNIIPRIAEFQSGIDNCFDEKITVNCDNTASHDLDHHMASMSMHKNKTRGRPSINGLYVNKIGDHVGDSPQLNNDEESSISVDGLHAISNGVHVGMGSKPSTNKQASEKLLIMMCLTDWIIFTTDQRRKFATMRRPKNFKNYGPQERVSFYAGGFGLEAKLKDEFFSKTESML